MKRLVLYFLVFITVAGYGCSNTDSAAVPQDKQALARPTYEILILVDSKELFLFKDEELYKIYQIAVGRSSDPTPKGDFTVTSMIKQPYLDAYGARWIGLSIPNIGIHGTNDPGSIGTCASSGCIRMRNEDIEELFQYVSVGMKVFIL